jgi:four helix bundle protein
MEEKATQISERLLDYGVSIIALCTKLNRTAVGRHISGQLLRCGTSAGANYEEARGAQSRPDFLDKLQIVLKEMRESMFWLKLIRRSNILQGGDLEAAIDETEQMSRIIAKSILTAKKRETQPGI